jgi:hypothetical protein
LLFFTKGKKTQRIWYYDLAHVKVGKKTPLTLAHFGFTPEGTVIDDAYLEPVPIIIYCCKPIHKLKNDQS